MRTVRRLYFYGLSYISAGVVIWGLVKFLRTLVSTGFAGNRSTQIAIGLSLILVGIPIFLLHWRAVQREALRDPEEHASRVRAVFLYAALFGTLLPAIYAVMAVLNREMVTLFGLPARQAWLGGEGTTLDNLIALAINAVAFFFFWKILRDDWLSETPEYHLIETRRLYRYLWVLVSLTMTITGAVNVLRFLFVVPFEGTGGTAATLAGGVTLLLAGTPLLIFFWSATQASLDDPDESRSLLRLVVLYLISFAGVIGVIIAGGRVINLLISWLSGSVQPLGTLVFRNSFELGAALPLAGMWWYFGRILNEEVAAMSDQPRREALRRLYFYILSLFGLATAFAGLLTLFDFVSLLAFDSQASFATLRDNFSDGMAALLVGAPLWWLTWRKMQFEASQKDDAGDRARRSVLRKAYLYLVLFLLVIGGMVFTGQLLYELLNALLGSSDKNLGVTLTNLFLSLALDIFLLIYHWRALREDSRIAQQTIGRLHAAFPTLVLIDETNADEQAFLDALLEALPRTAPQLPLAVHMMERGAPDETMLGAKAILLTIRTQLDPPESLRLWLNEYHGRRVLVPTAKAQWLWLGQAEKRPADLGREAAQALRQMAEGETIRLSLPNSPWSIAGYILGGIFGLLLFNLLLSLLLTSLMRSP